RVLRAKAALGLPVKRVVDLDQVDRVVSNPKFNETAQRIADQSITLVRNEQKLLPIDPKGSKGSLLNITFTDEEDRAIVNVFVDELRARDPRTESVLLDNLATESDIAGLLARLDEGKFDRVIFSIAVRARSGKGSVALPPIGKRISGELIKRKLRLIVISFGNPYLLMEMPESPSYLLAYCPFQVSQRSAAQALFGEIEINGKLPTPLPGLYPTGHGFKLEKREKSLDK